MIKKRAIISVLLLSAVLVAALCVPSVMRPLAERRLRAVFEGAEVSVAHFSLSFPVAAALSGIEIKSKQYEISVAKASIDPQMRLTLHSPKIRIKKIPSGWFESKSGAKIPLSAVEIKDLDLKLNLKAAGFEADIRGSAVYDFGTGLSTGRLVSDLIRWKNLSAKEVVLDAAGPRGTLAAFELKAGKLRATAVRGEVAAEPRSIRIAPLTADLAGGRAEGEVTANVENGLNYEATFRVQSIDMERLTRDFEMERKMTAGGMLDGKITLRGDRTGLLGLEGRLTAGAGGGDLVIRDAALIERLAQNVRQPVEIVEAAFKEYHFDAGSVSLGLEEGDIALSANLEGAKGKRDLLIRLHDQP